MTSSMLAGEKRWASSARRGGMTVLGKVAVPKPLNLPSQRLENHGLDPNVEIVPKGTLSWGSRTSSSSNAWGSSALSPNADGGTSSPNHLRSCPSSGGSGTRPSTAGSDRTQEPTNSAWGTSSRPSSASGALSSNNASSTLARPRSAETRPGSSQLSRFAEPSSGHPGAWGATITAERLGVMSSKDEGFSLSSGDFPTLGSDRDVDGKTTESQDHGSQSRPNSASGRVPQSLEKTFGSHSDVKGGMVDSWKRDGHSAEDGPQHSMEWQGEPHQYLGPNVPPQHFDSWRGPPMNAPAGLWYRGPPGGPPYGAPVPPGGFPIEPFPYFRPPIPPNAIANSQPVPPPGRGSRGHHPRGGDIYRPQITDAYIRPNMPFRPGFYSGPVAFEGYYGPPMGYCNSNEREIPLMGMPPGPPIYNRYPVPNTHDPNNTHASSGSYGGDTKVLPEGVASDHPDDTKGPYKVLLKHDVREEGETLEQSAPTRGPYPDRSLQRTLQKYERGAEHVDDRELYLRRTTGGGSCYPHGYDDRGGESSDFSKTNLSEGKNTMKVADGGWTKKSGLVESSGGVRMSTSAPEKDSFPAKDPSLMQKIEGLNAKVRASDGRYDASFVSIDEDVNKLELTSKPTNSISETKRPLTPGERTHTSGTTGSKGAQSVATMSRRPYHSAQTRNDTHGKARFDSHDDGWRKRPIASESSAVGSATCSEPVSHTSHPGPPVNAVEQASTDINVSGVQETMLDLHDSADTQAQRAKMKELARQRALQLQKEEEERIKQQKAKALAKLEELNRRMQAGDTVSQKAEKVSPPDVTKHGGEGDSILPEPLASPVKPQVHNSTLAAKCDVINASERILDQDVKFSSPYVQLEFGTSNFVESDIAIPQPQALQAKLDAGKDAMTHGKVHQSTDGVIKQKRTSHKQRANMTPKNMNEKPVLSSTTKVSSGQNDVIVNSVPSTEVHVVGGSAESNTVNNAKAAVESSVQQRKKGNRTNKNKQKLDAALPGPASPLPAEKDCDPSKAHTQHEKLNSSQPVLAASVDQAAIGGDNFVKTSDQSSSLPLKGNGRVTNQWKPQHPSKTQRNPHTNVHTDKFHGGDTVVWAPVHKGGSRALVEPALPVQSQSKTKDASEPSQKTVSDPVDSLKSDNAAYSNSKGKRAEMERYVPKPLAKELAQHNSTLPPVVSSGSSLFSDGTDGKEDMRHENSGCSLPTRAVNESLSAESRDGDGKANRPGKAHGVWRQRGSMDLVLDPNKNAQKSKCYEFEESDGWNMSGDPEGPRTITPAVGEGTTSKGKHYPSKGHRNMRNPGHEYKSSSGEAQHNHSMSGSQTDRRVAAKENRGMGNRTPHWQPKSQLAVSQTGMSTRVQNVSTEG